MSLPTVMTEEDFYKILPAGWDDDVDNEGQIIIYTGLMWGENNSVVPYEEEE